MKRILGTITLIIALTFLLVGCKNNEQQTPNNTDNVTQNMSQENNNSLSGEDTNLDDKKEDENFIEYSNPLVPGEALNVTSSATGLDESTVLEADEITANYDFGEYRELEKEIRSKETDEGIKEIAIVKLKDSRQVDDLLMVMSQRAAEIKSKYADNEAVMEILNNPESIVIKHEAGVVTFVVAENATEIVAELDKQIR